MKIYIFLFAITLLAACSNSKRDVVDSASIEKTAIEEVEVLDVSKLLENAANYDDQEIKIAGTVVHVCKHSGKRMHLLGQDEKTRIRVEAGEIGKFDRELEGSEVVASGIFRREVIDEEYLSKWENEIKNEGGNRQRSHEEQEEEKGKMKRYRSMMKEQGNGAFEQYWIDGISFEIVEEERSI